MLISDNNGTNCVAAEQANGQNYGRFVLANDLISYLEPQFNDKSQGI